ncbi:MAG: hypothetical protein R3C05_24010 [Pirellulaceae bacterium]
MEELKHEGFLPKFTLRWMAFYFTLSIFVAWVIRQAMQGSLWASAAIFTLAMCVALFLLYAIAFLAIWLPSSQANRNGITANRSNADGSSELSRSDPLLSEPSPTVRELGE